ncbi:nuclear transport factor 2 family protein [Pseudomonas sp. MF6755]|uniref:nuclear transport factor 2 family protein n=1 Tax=Pseudomonas sp. MF6755 TaxID=2797530 RepID=UPI0018E84146|nr:nuclear transport factor 2 family protein [Pseudomonas sp. MF6755]MBJ2285848.1 nuclear transport factor 2 family protein [Pseudomonas sp. MF6755]
MQNNKSILKTANEAIAIEDIEILLTFCDDNIHWLTVGEDAIVGKKAVRRWMKKEYVHPPRFSVTNMVAEGDLAGRYRGDRSRRLRW